MQILAIIPSRGGSKGVEMKNIRKLAGKPLIEYSIIVAKKSKFIDRIIVSTDDQEIVKISESLGAEVPFIRPKQFASDSSSNTEVVKHTLNFFKKKESYIPDIILLLQPTSPFRTTKMIDDSIKLLKKSNATSVLSVKEIKTHPYASFKYNGKFLRPFKSNFQRYRKRQERPPLYYPTGSIYTFWYDTFKRYASILGPRIKPMLVKDDYAFIDIDTSFDFFISEMIIHYWKDYKKIF